MYLVMISSTGPIPPTHRKYNEQASIEFIKNRYINLRNMIEKQVELLQHDELFCDLCERYYKKGYKDWFILSTIHPTFRINTPIHNIFCSPARVALGPSPESRSALSAGESHVGPRLLLLMLLS